MCSGGTSGRCRKQNSRCLLLWYVCACVHVEHGVQHARASAAAARRVHYFNSVPHDDDDDDDETKSNFH